MQAVAALRFVERLGRGLRFHTNAGRLEMVGAPILANLRGLFGHYPQHALVEEPWRPHEAFRALIRDMDLVTQVSFSETFNIVAADAVSQNVATEILAPFAWADLAPVQTRYYVGNAPGREVGELLIGKRGDLRAAGRQARLFLKR